MTAHHRPDEPQDHPITVDQPGADPLGPINLPPRSRTGQRAFALVGYTGAVAVGLMAAAVCVPITTSVSAP